VYRLPRASRLSGNLAQRNKTTVERAKTIVPAIWQRSTAQISKIKKKNRANRHDSKSDKKGTNLK
jgi:hypothetical protein